MFIDRKKRAAALRQEDHVYRPEEARGHAPSGGPCQWLKARRS